MWIWRFLHSQTCAPSSQAALSVARTWTSVVLNIHPTQAFLLPSGAVTIPTPETNSRGNCSVVIPRDPQCSVSPQLCDMWLGLGSSSVRSKNPKGGSSLCETNELHNQRLPHSWGLLTQLGLQPPLCFAFVQRVKQDPGRAQCDSSKGRQKRPKTFWFTFHSRTLRILDLKPSRK